MPDGYRGNHSAPTRRATKNNKAQSAQQHECYQSRWLHHNLRVNKFQMHLLGGLKPKPGADDLLATISPSARCPLSQPKGSPKESLPRPQLPRNKIMDPKQAIYGAIFLVSQNYRLFARVMLAPMGLHIAIIYALSESTQRSESLLVIISMIYLQSIIAINTHRIILLGGASVPYWGFRLWGWREIYFTYYIAFFAFLVYLPIALASFFPLIDGAIAGMILYLWLLSRSSLVLPAIAIDRKMSFRSSWRLTKNHQGSMFLVVGIFPFLITISLLTLGWLLQADDVILTSLEPILNVLTVAALSLAYKGIMITEAETNSQTGTAELVDDDQPAS